jgi:Family of unknown function (DUF6356)
MTNTKDQNPMLKSAFTDHPASVGETYGQHMGVAFSFAGRMFLASLACLIHGFLPFLFVRTGSCAITELHDRMVTHRDRRTADQDETNTSRAAAA